MPAELTLPLDRALGFLLVGARVGGAFACVPLPGVNAGPQPARVLLTLGITVALEPLWPSVPVAAASPGRMAVWMISEAAFGVTVGVAAAFLIETLLIASQIFGLQAGYSYASTVDPTTQADSNVLMVFSNLTAGLLFFAFGLDRAVLRIFARSLASHPPGTYAPGAAAGDAIVALGGNMLATGLRLAMPVVALLLLVDIALALAGRIHQQLQLLTLAFPIKMLAALAFLGVVMAYFPPVWRAAAERTLARLAEIL